MRSLKKICEEHLSGRNRIEVVDVVESPERAIRDQIVAIPTEVRKLPVPIRTKIGGVSNIRPVLAAVQVSDN